MELTVGKTGDDVRSSQQFDLVSHLRVRHRVSVDVGKRPRLRQLCSTQFNEAGEQARHLTAYETVILTEGAVVLSQRDPVLLQTVGREPRIGKSIGIGR